MTDAPAAPKEPPTAQVAAEDPSVDWKTHRMGGASFRYPPNWTVRSSAYGLSLIPNDGQENDEVITITGTTAQGIRSASDARIGRTLDELITGAMPGLRRTGRPVKVDAGQDRKGARYDYAGISTDGRKAVASAFVVVQSGKAAGISIVATPETMDARRDTISRVFRSFDDGSKTRRQSRDQGNQVGAATDSLRDPRLIGMFGGESILAKEGVYMNTQLVYALGSDGVMHYGARSLISASETDSSGGFRWTASGTTGENTQSGTWTTKNGIVEIQWDQGGAVSFAYGFEPDGTLALRHPVTAKLINIYRRVEQ